MPSGGGFRVEMPDARPCNRSRGPAEIGSLPGWVCSSSDGGGLLRRFGSYSASSFELPAGLDRRLVETWAGESLSREARDVGAIVVERRARELGGAAWSETLLEGETSEMRFRLVSLLAIRPEGVFRLVVTGPIDDWPSDAADRFVRSFRFVGRPGDSSAPERR